MQLRLLIAIVLILGVYALITKPFQNSKKLREFASHFVIAFLTYYGVYAVLFLFGSERDIAMTIAAGATAVTLVVINMFFRKPSA